MNGSFLLGVIVIIKRKGFAMVFHNSLLHEISGLRSLRGPKEQGGSQTPRINKVPQEDSEDRSNSN